MPEIGSRKSSGRLVEAKSTSNLSDDIYITNNFNFTEKIIQSFFLFFFFDNRGYLYIYI